MPTLARLYTTSRSCARVRPRGEHKCTLKFLVSPTERSGNWRGSHGNIFCYSLCFSTPPGDVCARMSVTTPRPYFFAAWQRRRFVLIPVKFKQEILFSLCTWRSGGMIRNETVRAPVLWILTAQRYRNADERTSTSDNNFVCGRTCIDPVDISIGVICNFPRLFEASLCAPRRNCQKFIFQLIWELF